MIILLSSVRLILSFLSISTSHDNKNKLWKSVCVCQLLLFLEPALGYDQCTKCHSIEEINFPSPSTNQIPRTYWLGEGLSDHFLSFVLRFCLAWTCPGSPVSVYSCVHLPYCVWKSFLRISVLFLHSFCTLLLINP